MLRKNQHDLVLLKHPETLHRVSYWWMSFSSIYTTFVSTLSLTSQFRHHFYNSDRAGDSSSVYLCTILLSQVWHINTRNRSIKHPSTKFLIIISFQIISYLLSDPPPPPIPLVPDFFLFFKWNWVGFCDEAKRNAKVRNRYCNATGQPSWLFLAVIPYPGALARAQRR